MDKHNQKNKVFDEFYKSLKSGTEIFSVEELDRVIESLKVLQTNIKEIEQELILNKKKKLPVKENKTQKFYIADTDYGKVLYLPSGLTKLTDKAFKGNEEIVKVVMNQELTEIGEYAFCGCKNLKELVFPRNRIVLKRGCFSECESLEKIEIPNVPIIGPSAFENCTALETVKFSAHAYNIYSSAFKNCYSLKNVLFECIGVGKTFQGVFENCISLETVNIPSGLHLDKKTFLNCVNLKEIRINNQYVRYDEFEGCNAEMIYL